jgi:hypothetical protein
MPPDVRERLRPPVKLALLFLGYALCCFEKKQSPWRNFGKFLESSISKGRSPIIDQRFPEGQSHFRTSDGAAAEKSQFKKVVSKPLL